LPLFAFAISKNCRGVLPKWGGVLQRFNLEIWSSNVETLSPEFGVSSSEFESPSPEFEAFCPEFDSLSSIFGALSPEFDSLSSKVDAKWYNFDFPFFQCNT
jgi:hypothetical protein